ncbi:hypothetical protein NONI108955_17215 [Nocardia ninae]|uniref:Uncharacterized protein n=2 Tax=Nocardia ninae TaxID=356145 RepID=A0A511MG67_9NOCA|nr:hypothetical protein NN4_41710 [Nocardia ninae NBRC 108245]
MSDSLYSGGMSARRLAVLLALALFAVLGVSACTVEGAGTKTDCGVSGCTVTFDRGVNAKVTIIGVDAELVAVNGDTVTLKVGGQQVSVPAGQTQSADGFNVTVQEVTADKVVVKIASGITTG